MTMRLVGRAALVAAAATVACTPVPVPDPQLVAQWLRTSLSFVRAERLGPPVAARIAAYGGIALHEGYASDVRSGLASLAGRVNGLDSVPRVPDGARVDGAIVAAEAARVVLDSMFRDGFASTRRAIDSLSRAQVAARAALGVRDAERDRSVEHGARLGAAILAWAETDGFFATRGRSWVPPSGRDKWVNTATTDQYVPQMLSAASDVVMTGNSGIQLELERASEKWVFTNRPKEAKPTTLPTFDPIRPTAPYWGELRPIVLADADACQAPPPPAYSERPGSPFWLMGKEFYDSVKALTPEKRAIAFFWTDNPVATGTPGFHWVSVVNQMVARRGLSAPAAAELNALVSIAIHDAFIASWKEKYRSLVVRPVTYVRRVFDPKYQTEFATPPFPEYPSGHSVLSGSAARVLIGILGDTIPFTDSTQVDIGLEPRSYTSFTQARNEVAVSRVYGGIHYLPAVTLGVAQGDCVGNRVLERLWGSRPGR